MSLVVTTLIVALCPPSADFAVITVSPVATKVTTPVNSSTVAIFGFAL